MSSSNFTILKFNEKCCESISCIPCSIYEASVVVVVRVLALDVGNSQVQVPVQLESFLGGCEQDIPYLASLTLFY